MKKFAMCFVAALLVLLSDALGVLAAVPDAGVLTEAHPRFVEWAPFDHKNHAVSGQSDVSCLLFNVLGRELRASNYQQVVPVLFPPVMMFMLPLECVGINSNGELLLKIITAP